MSFLVELARGAYPDNALNGFTASSQFGLDDARAMMWLSQLAYETAHRDKVKSILDAWHLTMPAFIANDPATGLPPRSACVVIAAGRGATFVTFAGSDPLKFEDWITPGNSTFRLINGTDIVPTIPPAQPGDYRHVGQSIQCPTDGRFDGAPGQISAAAANRPDIIDGAIAAGLADIRALAAFRLIRRIGPRPLDRLAGALPRMVRDHVPANYFRALAIKL